MYLRKISLRTTCLYSAASILLRSLSAASQSFCSKPILAELLDEGFDFPRDICRATILAQRFIDEKGKIGDLERSDYQNHSLSSLGFGSLSEPSVTPNVVSISTNS